MWFLKFTEQAIQLQDQIWSISSNQYNLLLALLNHQTF